MGAGENDLAALADGNVVALVVDDANGDAVRRPTARVEQCGLVAERPLMVDLAQDRADRRDLRHSVQLQEDGAVAGDEVAQAVG